ncbi:MAG: hypothetical protein MK102_11395 [Fuerstiella sp.]|nr:hypothetical protein [Fuerstiella sp.]
MNQPEEVGFVMRHRLAGTRITTVLIDTSGRNGPRSRKERLLTPRGLAFRDVLTNDARETSLTVNKREKLVFVGGNIGTSSAGAGCRCSVPLFDLSDQSSGYQLIFKGNDEGPIGGCT